ncbi:MFS transporter [Deinococcus lacus]|uniref:MFS transporter n=1 Tax=Deinococcus lacus TaxID=392561 RepID=A0ABW1YD47_9DEIO
MAPEQLAQANSLRSGALMGAPLLGYGLGGVLVTGLGAGPTLLACAPFIAALSVAAWWLPRLATQDRQKLNPLRDLQVGLNVIFRSRYLLGLLTLSFVLNAAMNLMNTRSPLFMRDFGRGAPDYALYEMLTSGGVLLGIVLVTPLGKRWPLDRLIGTGCWVLALASAGFVVTQVPAWWAAGLVFGAGVGLVEVAGTTRSQEVIPAKMRGRVMGALMSVNAFGLVAGAALASLALSTQALMLGLCGVLLALALGWRHALKAEPTSPVNAE